MYRLTLAKEDFKFSAAHLTLLSPHEAERLHGHNYQVRVYVNCKSLDEWEFAFEFNTLKRKIRSLIANWDERVLVPAQSPYLEIERSERGTQVSLNLKSPDTTSRHNERSAMTQQYVFPSGDVIELPVRNITSEALARILAFQLASMWRLDAPQELITRIEELEVHVEETRGQSAGFILPHPLRSRLAGQTDPMNAQLLVSPSEPKKP
jgi:6-pyruvoyltetrahydropterin/6-carboxytetrahydropterin synthase